MELWNWEIFSPPPSQSVNNYLFILSIVSISWPLYKGEAVPMCKSWILYSQNSPVQRDLWMPGSVRRKRLRKWYFAVIVIISRGCLYLSIFTCHIICLFFLGTRRRFFMNLFSYFNRFLQLPSSDCCIFSPEGRVKTLVLKAILITFLMYSFFSSL